MKQRYHTFYFGVLAWLCLLTTFTVVAQNKQPVSAQNNLWQTALMLNNAKTLPTDLPLQYLSVIPDAERIKTILTKAPIEFTRAAGQPENLPLLSIPMPNGENLVFGMVESPIMEAGLAARYPDIKTYKGIAPDELGSMMRLTVSSLGIYAFVSTPQGIVAIEPMRGSVVKGLHIVYFNQHLTNAGYTCGTPNAHPGSHIHDPANDDYRGSCGSIGSFVRNYNIAIAATGELTTQYGGTTQATNFIVSTLNAITLIFERELAIRLTLIANNSSLIFTNGGTDPFNPAAASLPVNAHDGITATIGSSGWNIGHVFHYGASNSGIAGLGVVCTNSQKGRGWSSINNIGFSSWVLLVAHEIGHQFGAQHSFYGTQVNCSQRSNTSAYEPGSGTTIMSYQGTCGSDNIGTDTDDYFHAVSLQQMRLYVNSQSCHATVNTGNTVPVAVANPTASSFTIPIQTPFELTGSGSDADGNPITYCWENFDTDGSAGSAPNAAATSTTAPLFRSFYPTTNPTRTFPQLSDILNNTQTLGEILPQVARTMNFRLTVRDNNPSGSGFDCDATSVAVAASSGPFNITSQNSPTTLNANGTNTATITWNVANTTAAPVSCANVTILFSTNGGQSFPFTLVASTPNDGTETITIPSYPTGAGRIKVKCANNIFFDINNAAITLNSPCAANGSTISPATPVTAPAGNPALDLNLAPNYGTQYTNFSGAINTADPQSFLATNNSGSCVSFGANITRYDAYSFMVSVSGNYTFTRASGSGLVMHLYNGSFNANDPCANWLASSYNLNTGMTATTLTQSLSAGLVYTFVIGTFNASNPSLPVNYTVNFTAVPSGGGLFNGTPPPPAGYAYTYVMVNNSTGVISGVNASSDLSDSGKFNPAIYSVYGFSYQTSTLANPAILEGTTFESLQNSLALLTYCGNLSSNFVTVTVEPGGACTLPPAPTINAPGNTNLCAAGSITLSASAIPGGFAGYGYQWYKDGTPLGGAINQNYTPTTGGSYTVRLENGLCISAPSNAVVITQNVPAALSISPASVTICQGNSTTLTASAIDPAFVPAFTYRWFNNGVVIGGQTAQTLNVTAAGNYTVVAYASEVCASATSNVVAVTVIPAVSLPNTQDFSGAFAPAGWNVQNPDAGLTWAAQTTTCYGQSAYINFFNYLSQGQEDFLLSPLYNLTGFATATLSFDVAYARYDGSFFDGLRVEVSTNCGSSYTTVYLKTGSTLATAPDNINNFVPANCSQWRTETVDLSPYAGNPVLVRFVALNGYGNNLYIDNVNLAGTAGAGVRVEANLLLEGAYNTGSNNMNTTLRNNNLLPLNQPYNKAPWNYNGSESVASIPANVVDWILVDVHDAADNFIARRAAFLRNDGVALHTDGTVGALFTSGLTAGNTYRLVIRHRNHLAVVGNNTLTLPNTNSPYNFTQLANVRGTATQVVLTSGGGYALQAADANANGIIKFLDHNLFFAQNGQSNGYFDADFNLDGNVNNADWNFYNLRAGAIGVNLIRY